MRMDVRGTNEFKEISLTLGQELRPVSDLHQTSALRSDCSSLKPSAQHLILSEILISESITLLTGGRVEVLPALQDFSSLKKKKNPGFSPAHRHKQSSLLLAWFGKIPSGAPTKSEAMNNIQAIFFLHFTCCSCVMGLELTHGKRQQLWSLPREMQRWNNVHYQPTKIVKRRKKEQKWWQLAQSITHELISESKVKLQQWKKKVFTFCHQLQTALLPWKTTLDQLPSWTATGRQELHSNLDFTHIH